MQTLLLSCVASFSWRTTYKHLPYADTAAELRGQLILKNHIQTLTLCRHCCWAAWPASPEEPHTNTDPMQTLLLSCVASFSWRTTYKHLPYADTAAELCGQLILVAILQKVPQDVGRAEQKKTWLVVVHHVCTQLIGCLGLEHPVTVPSCSTNTQTHWAFKSQSGKEKQLSINLQLRYRVLIYI